MKNGNKHQSPISTGKRYFSDYRVILNEVSLTAEPLTPCDIKGFDRSHDEGPAL